MSVLANVCFYQNTIIISYKEATALNITNSRLNRLRTIKRRFILFQTLGLNPAIISFSHLLGFKSNNMILQRKTKTRKKNNQTTRVLHIKVVRKISGVEISPLHFWCKSVLIPYISVIFLIVLFLYIVTEVKSKITAPLC